MTSGNINASRMLGLALLLGVGLAARADDAIGNRIWAVENGLLPEYVIQGRSEQTMTLKGRMAHFGVPGVSVAVIDDYAVEWARAYGAAQANRPTAVRPDTLFQAASLSKPVTATAVLTLVETGRLGLDEDVNRRLRGWRLPENEHTRTTPVTLAHLLSHTAGINQHGFSGYAPGSSLPSLRQILDGQGPANSLPIRVQSVPGSQWRYSGGGYQILQQLLEDVSGKDFRRFMQEVVMSRTGMPHSTFAQPLPLETKNRASGHQADGTPIGGQVYPELAAAGLWSTAPDLARFVVSLQRSVAGLNDGLLSPAMSRRMLSAHAEHWGLGFHVGGSGDDHWFHHAGHNRGFACVLFGYRDRGQGAVIMTNSDNGEALALEILRGIGRVYGWPDLQPEQIPVADVDPAVYEAYAGEYLPESGGPAIRISQERDRLYARVSGEKRELFPASEEAYFSLDRSLELDFIKDAEGSVSRLSLTLQEFPFREIEFVKRWSAGAESLSR